ncbi:MAG: hypothetical protein QM783_15005 [Phycisphaerales bacterium]
MSVLSAAISTVTSGLQPIAVIGRVEAVRGLSVLVRDLPAPVGSLVHLPDMGIGNASGSMGEVVGFAGQQTIVMMLGQTTGIRGGPCGGAALDQVGGGWPVHAGASAERAGRADRRWAGAA